METKEKNEKRVLTRAEYQMLQERLRTCSELSHDDRETLLSLIECYDWTQQELQKANSSIAKLKQFFGFTTEKKEKPFYVGMLKKD